MATITDLGFTSNGKRLYHVVVETGDDTDPGKVNMPCMQILATVPAVDFAENKLTITADEIGLTYLVIAA